MPVNDCKSPPKWEYWACSCGSHGTKAGGSAAHNAKTGHRSTPVKASEHDCRVDDATECPYTDGVAAIVETYDDATPAMRADGADWYPRMAGIMADAAAKYDVTVAQAAAVYAANSINTPWARNVTLADRALADFAAGRLPLCNGGTLGMVIRKVRAILAGEPIAAILSDGKRFKLANFAANLAGDYDAVTVDRWAHRIYSRGTNSSIPTGKAYAAIADAYRTAATMRGVSPATMQAVTWCVIRGTGE